MFRPEEYDKIVNADIPNKVKYPYLYRMAKKHMMYGPCGVLNPSSVCMTKNGRCRHSYPKDFVRKQPRLLILIQHIGEIIMVLKSKLDNITLIINGLFPIMPIYLLNLIVTLMLRFVQQFRLLNTSINRFVKGMIESVFILILIIQTAILMKSSSIGQLAGSHHLRLRRDFFILLWVK